MKESTILRDYQIMKDPLFGSKASHISMCMTGNKYFTKLTPVIKELGDAVRLFIVALMGPQAKNVVHIADMHAKRKSLTEVLDRLADYLTDEAKGNHVKLVSTGYTIDDGALANVPLGQFKNFKVKPGNNSGEIKVSFARVSAALHYQYCYTPTPVNDDNWKVLADTRLTLTITGLTPGVEYAVRVCAVGRKDKYLYSNSIIILVV